MKRIALIALTTILVAAPAIARADDTSKRAKIEELFTVMHVDQNMKQIQELATREIKTAAVQQFHGATPTPDQQKKLDDFQQKANTVVEAQIGWDKVKPDFLQMYSEAYSEPEVDGILAFYKSPAGQAMLTKMPQLTTKSLELSRTRLQQAEPEIRQLLQEFAKDVNTTPAPTTPAPGTPTPAPTAPKGM